MLNAECNHIQSILLWRSVAHFDFLKKRSPLTKSFIYRVETEDVAVSRKTSIKTVYMSGKEATLALKTEPWIVDTVSSLPMVHSYRKVTFGDGANQVVNRMIASRIRLISLHVLLKIIGMIQIIL